MKNKNKNKKKVKKWGKNKKKTQECLNNIRIRFPTNVMTNEHEFYVLWSKHVSDQWFHYHNVTNHQIILKKYDKLMIETNVPFAQTCWIWYVFGNLKDVKIWSFLSSCMDPPILKHILLTLAYFALTSYRMHHAHSHHQKRFFW